MVGVGGSYDSGGLGIWCTFEISGFRFKNEGTILCTSYAE